MIKLGFALLSGSQNPIPSTRIACLNLFPLLRSSGYEPIVLFEPIMPSTEPDIGNLVERAVAVGVAAVIFQKIRGPSVLNAVSGLRAVGIRSIYCVCDLVDNEMAATVDVTIVISEYMKSLYCSSLQSRIFVVHDGLERPDVVREVARREKGWLKAILVTSQAMYNPPVIGTPPEGWQINIVGKFFPRDCYWQRLQDARWALNVKRGISARMTLLKAMLHPRINYIAWDQDGVYENLTSADIAIIPIDDSDLYVSPDAPVPYWKIKSDNRLTLKMAVGLPVIATPIPSYESVIEHGVNGVFARSRHDWLLWFNRLKDPDLRNQIGLNARKSVIRRFSVEMQFEKFVNVIDFATRNIARTAIY